MKENKGFTLIELLAVIVILAIIALIATPIIIGVIEQARQKAAENSAYGVIDAARLAYTESLMTSSSLSLGTSHNVNTLSISGEKPKSGTFTISTDGQITLTDVIIGEYKCSGGNEGASKLTCTKEA